MYGAIIGDVLGSIYEFDNYRNTDFDLFTPEMFYTDDTVMTLAVAKSIMSNKNIADLPKETVVNMRKLGLAHPYCSYGAGFQQWLTSPHAYAYDSYGNGAAMRISYCGEAGKTLEDVKRLSYEVTRVTHNHYEGLRGAEAVSVAIWLANHHYSKRDIMDRIVTEYYPTILLMTCDFLRKYYRFNESCQNTVPQAFRCFLEGNSFEEVMRLAISIGGDSDTIGAIAGSLAEAYFGVPKEFKEKVEEYLPADLLNILHMPQKVYSVQQHTEPTKNRTLWYMSNE